MHLSPLPSSWQRLRDPYLPPDLAAPLARLGWAAFDLPSAELLDRHFHQVVVGRDGAGDPVVANIKLAPLTVLAEELGRTLEPVQPAPRFRQDLGHALTAAHRQRMARRTLGAEPSAPIRRFPTWGRWLALALGILLLLVARRRTA